MYDKGKNIFFFIIMMYSGGGSSFYNSQPGIIALFLISLIIMFFNDIKLNNNIAKISAVWIFYVILVTLRNQEFNSFHAFRILSYIITSYIIFKLYYKDFGYRYEKLIVNLALISILFYLWESLSKSSLLTIAEKIDISMGLRGDYHILVYSLTTDLYSTFLHRNYGFCFEPGPYSIYLNVAIYFNIMHRGLNFKNNRNFWVLFITLLTTLSTTGYITFSAMILYFMNKSNIGLRKYIYIAIIFLGFFYIFFNYDFMLNKIITTYNDQLYVEENLASANKAGKYASAGRVGGAILAYKDFQNYPLLGTGGLTALSVAKEGTGLAIINGWALTLSQYGFFGIVVVFLGLKKTSAYFAQQYASKFRYGLLVVLGLSMVSFSYFSQIMLFIFIFIGIFNLNLKAKS